MRNLSPDAQQGFLNLLKVILAIDTIWSMCVATFVAFTYSSMLGNAGVTGVLAGSIFLWFLTFMAAFFQGGIFLIVLTLLGITLYGLFSKLGESGNKRRFDRSNSSNDSDNNQ